MLLGISRLKDMTRRLAWSSLLLAGVAFSAEPMRLPAWFWETPPVEGGQATVGYASPYYTRASSFDEAFNDAATRLWADQDCRIAVQTGSSTHGDQLMHMGSVIRIESDTTGFGAFKETLVRVDSCWTDDLVVMLVSTRACSAPAQRVSSPNDKPQQAAGTIQSEGISPQYRFIASSWRQAEQESRKHLALTANPQIQTLQKSRDERLHYTSAISSEISVRGIRTIARRWDSENDVFSVIINAPRNAIVVTNARND